MIFNVKIKLITEFLGSCKINANNIRSIARVGECPKLFIKPFISSLKKYTADVNVDPQWFDDIEVSPKCIVLNDKKSTYGVMKHREKNSNLESSVSYEMYEPGTEFLITFRCPNTNVTKEIVYKIMKLIGEFNGISPFGSKWGYGLFEVIDVNE